MYLSKGYVVIRYQTQSILVDVSWDLVMDGISTFGINRGVILYAGISYVNLIKDY